MRRTHVAAVVAVRDGCGAGVFAGQQEDAADMRSKGLTDVPGIKVGHVTRPERPTGCTVILAEAGAVAGVDVRGSAPGTIETDLLNPSQPGAAGARGVPVRRQRVRARRRDGHPKISLRAENWIRDARRESADRAGRDYLRSRRRRTARHLADRRLRLSRGHCGDAMGMWPKGTSGQEPARPSGSRAAAAR